MHISPDGLDKPEDLALLSAVLRTGARPAGTAERTPPTIEDRFGGVKAAFERQDAEARVDDASRTIATES